MFNKRSKKLNSLSFVAKVWGLIQPFHKTMYLIAGITTVFEIARMGGPYIFSRILNVLIQTKGLISFQTAIVLIAGLAGIRVLSLLIDFTEDLVVQQMLYRANRHVSTMAFNKLLQLSLDYHEKVSTGKKINLINHGVDKLIELVGAFAFEFEPIILQLLVTSIMIFLTNWFIGIIFTLSLFPFLLITYQLVKSNSKLRATRHEFYEIQSGEIGDTITNVSVVKAYAQEEREYRGFESIWTDIFNLSNREFHRNQLGNLGRSLVVEIFDVTLLSVALFEIHIGALSIGGLVFLFNLIERAYSNIYRLGRIYYRASDAEEPVTRISELMRLQPTVVNSTDAIHVDSLDGSIKFDHVSFGYSKNEVLHDVNFTIPAGTFTALVGKSGSGKSTIAKLLSRYYDPTSGAIVIDDKYKLKDLDIDDYRRQTAVVFQDAPVPNRRIWEVISYAAGQKSYASVKDQVIEAAKLAHAHDFILELDHGYQTLIGERGVKLSGGQRQRLAIARALFAQPRILVMDEPTSHLDTLSENMIQKALVEISKQRSFTKIIIAHRLSTVQHADQILVMDKGRLVERGTHHELIAKKGLYADIVHQSELKP